MVWRKENRHLTSECSDRVVQIFCAPSFDDKILEVVAVFGGMQMAVSRVIKLQHHRIAQVRSQPGLRDCGQNNHQDYFRQY